MFGNCYTKEPPLHQAVIDNDIDRVKELAQQPAEFLKVNALGFTALEIAHFLDRKESITLLDKAPPHSITVQLPDAAHTKELSESDFNQEFNIDYAPYLRFASYKELKKVIRECPLMIKNKVTGHEQRELGQKYSEMIASGRTKKLTIKWIDSVIGFGVYSQELIQPGEYIGEYTGLLRQTRRNSHDFNAYCFHYPTRFWSLNYYIVDAQNEGNITRFINHSDEPNLEPFGVYDRGLLHLVLISNRQIPPNTQLTYDYGDDYWQRRIKLPL
ncbi:MAG: SET domain-containing protein-lysine N-methyltransferase [Chlamydiales bacterium]|nr:SET domain-containing protein-lysine N-methyltransferase [Chlamydiia bacterium]MCP5507349.1 SET domain-containing protein-lysine N-methyltransferase [Chlamydiales bacterium]